MDAMKSYFRVLSDILFSVVHVLLPGCSVEIQSVLDAQRGCTLPDSRDYVERKSEETGHFKGLASSICGGFR
jgi:hypothetical protein